MRMLMIICLAGVLAMLTGCAGGKEATRAGGGVDSSATTVSDLSSPEGHAVLH